MQTVPLSRGDEPPPCKSEERVSPTVRRTIDNLGHNPAYVLGRRWDYLAWNAATVALLCHRPKSVRLYH